MSSQIEKVKLEIKDILEKANLFSHQAFLLEFDRLNSKSVLGYCTLCEEVERTAYREFKVNGKSELVGDIQFDLSKDGLHGFRKKLMKDFLSLYSTSDFFKKPFFLIIREHENPPNCGITEYLGTSEFAQRLHDKVFKK